MTRTQLRWTVYTAAAIVLAGIAVVRAYVTPVTEPWLTILFALPLIVVVVVGFTVIDKKRPLNTNEIAAARAIWAKTMIDVVVATCVGFTAAVLMHKPDAAVAFLAILLFDCASFWLRYLFDARSTNRKPRAQSVGPYDN